MLRSHTAQHRRGNWKHRQPQSSSDKHACAGTSELCPGPSSQVCMVYGTTVCESKGCSCEGLAGWGTPQGLVTQRSPCLDLRMADRCFTCKTVGPGCLAPGASTHLALDEEDAVGHTPPQRSRARSFTKGTCCPPSPSVFPPPQFCSACGSRDSFLLCFYSFRPHACVVSLTGQKGPEVGLATQGPLLSAGIRQPPSEEGGHGVRVGPSRCWLPGVIQSRALLPSA